MILNLWSKPKLKPADLPPSWNNYLRQFERTYSKDQPLETIRFVIMDTETTGLRVKKDRLLSIGAVAVQNWRIEVADRFESYIEKQAVSYGDSIPIHGILPVDRAGCVSAENGVFDFLDYASDSIIVGHHIGFDIAIINQVLSRSVGKKLQNKVVDTARMAQRLHPANSYAQPGTFSLDSLCEQYNIPASDRHTASGDAFITAILFLKLLNRLQQRGVRTLRDLLRR